MELSLNALAKKHDVRYEICKDREKINTQDIIYKFPKGITIDEVEVIEVNDTQKVIDPNTAEIVETNVRKKIWAYHFVEAPDRFAFMGTVLTQYLNYFVQELGSVENVYKAFKDGQRFSVRLYMGKTKQNKDVVSVEVLD